MFRKRPLLIKNNQLQPIQFADFEILPGESNRFELPISRMHTQNWVSIPIHVVYGEKPGPTLCLSSTLHGDEICGMEIIREIIPIVTPKNLHGILIYAPVVNIFGFMNNSRYLPDRRDLNRCFPGSDRGSMGSRLANMYTQEIISKCDYAIDFHTAAVGKMNYPQVRANLDDVNLYEFAKSFQAPIMIHSKEIQGSLRETAARKNCRMIVFEGGEVNRFDPFSIQVAIEGIFHALKKLKMFSHEKKAKKIVTEEFRSTKWVRSSKSGLFHFSKTLGTKVKHGENIGVVSNIFGDAISNINAPFDGVVVGMATNPKVYQGDAILHVAKK